MARSPFYKFPGSFLYEFRIVGLHGPWYYHGTKTLNAAGPYSFTPGHPVTADVNGDGREDLIFSPNIFPHVEAHPPTYPIVLVGTKSGTLAKKSGFTIGSGSLGHQSIYRFATGDINLDGITDVVGSSTASYPQVPGERQMLVYGSSGGIQDQTNLLPYHADGSDPKIWSRDVSVGDIDADGDLDILFSGGMKSRTFFLNDSRGAHFSDISDRLPAAIADPSVHTNNATPFLGGVQLADLNGDNAADIIAPYIRGEINGYIGLNNGSGLFPDASTIQLPTGLYGSNTKNDDIAVADIDGDGFKDIILSQGQADPYYVGRQLQIIKNYGGAEFKDESWRIAGDKDRAGSKGHAEGTIYTIDFDADGDIDILDTTQAEPGVIGNRLFLNDGKGHFKRASDTMLPVIKTHYGSTAALVPINLGNKHGYDFAYFFQGGDGKTYGSLKAYLIKAQGLTLTGKSGADKLNGGPGADSLSGMAGNDVLNGGARHDRLKGGPGLDKLTGGSGKDRFIFGAGDTGTSRKTADIILDFSGAKGDRIDLSAIDANVYAKGNQAFTFMGGKSFTKPGQIRYTKSGGDTYVFFNTDKDAAPEGVIRLKGAMDMMKGWFVL